MTATVADKACKLLNPSQGIGVSADLLLHELVDTQWWERETSNLLWDKLFENLTDFLYALDHMDLRALATKVSYLQFAEVSLNSYGKRKRTFA